MELFFTYLQMEFDRLAAAFSWVEFAGILFLTATLLETGWDFVFRNRTDWRQTATNTFLYIGTIALDFLGLGLLFLAGLFVIEPFAVFDLKNTAQNDWWYWPLLVLLADLCYYWMHRIEHKSRIFWAVHVVHHSSEEFNLTTAFRLSWFEGLFEWIFLIPLVLLGYGTIEVLLAFLIVVQYQTWLHTKKIDKLGWLDQIINTPSNHRVHHGSNPECIDKNYGGILMIWDHFFGTYQKEQTLVKFGITNPLHTANPLMVLTHEFINIVHDLRQRKSIKDWFRTVFGPPGG